MYDLITDRHNFITTYMASLLKGMTSLLHTWPHCWQAWLHYHMYDLIAERHDLITTYMTSLLTGTTSLPHAWPHLRQVWLLDICMTSLLTGTTSLLHALPHCWHEWPHCWYTWLHFHMLDLIADRHDFITTYMTSLLIGMTWSPLPRVWPDAAGRHDFLTNALP